MNEPIAWLDGLIALFFFPIAFMILAYLFPQNSMEA